VNCPHCGKPLSARLIRKQGARLLSAKRKTHGGGRPRTDAPRCPCGTMTLKRAETRKHVCEAP
jgi:hypothetical protein